MMMLLRGGLDVLSGQVQMSPLSLSLGHISALFFPSMGFPHPLRPLPSLLHLAGDFQKISTSVGPAWEKITPQCPDASRSTRIHPLPLQAWWLGQVKARPSSTKWVHLPQAGHLPPA